MKTAKTNRYSHVPINVIGSDQNDTTALKKIFEIILKSRTSAY